jgi:hypothetical protein
MVVTKDTNPRCATEGEVEIMPCAYLFSDRYGHEILSVADLADQLPIPLVGETIKLHHDRYKVESVKMIESPSPGSLATEYRVRVLFVGGFSLTERTDA